MCSKLNTQNSELRTQNSELKTQYSILKTTNYQLHKFYEFHIKISDNPPNAAGSARRNTPSSVIRVQYSILRTQYSILNTQYSELNTQYSILNTNDYQLSLNPSFPESHQTGINLHCPAIRIIKHQQQAVAESVALPHIAWRWKNHL